VNALLTGHAVLACCATLSNPAASSPSTSPRTLSVIPVSPFHFELPDTAFVFSPDPDGQRALVPDTATQRYGRLVRRLGQTGTGTEP
jgi:hypothetical protein